MIGEGWGEGGDEIVGGWGLGDCVAAADLRTDGKLAGDDDEWGGRRFGKCASCYGRSAGWVFSRLDLVRL